MTIERAKPGDHGQLKELWSVVFSEEPAFLEHFFTTRYAPEHIFVARVDDQIVSALHALPSAYLQNGVEKPCSFIVGAATYEAYRKRGIMSELLKATKNAYDHPITLYPAVRPFYEANDYFTTSSVLSLPLEGVEKQNYATISPDYHMLDTLYRREHKQHGCLLRDIEGWRFLTEGYQTIVIEDAYAFVSEGKAVEACAAAPIAAARLLGLLSDRNVTEIHVLDDSCFAQLLGTEKAVPIPMGMSTDSSMAGVYIAEQY